jgi:hypothetical protein
MIPNKNSIHSCRFATGRHWLPLLALLLPTAVFAGGAGQEQQATYASPEEAVEALVAAARVGDVAGIVRVLGPEGRALASSGDPVADAAGREKFTTAYDETHEIRQGDSRATLVIGQAGFPFPIPLVRSGDAWRFDTVAGADEILDRRIGENELSAVEVLRTCVAAQREYAEVDRDGKGVQYARVILSSAGQSDGLYWPTAEGAPESPLGPLVADARAEGYSRHQGRPTPYHGYLFKVLTRQGKDAAGGARDYVVNGRMIGGFAFVAAPAEYGASGVMTFIVNQDGTVFQKDLGPDTDGIAAAMTTFNPDSTWLEIVE